MYIYTPLCRYWIALYRYVLVFIVPHVDIELEDNKQFISKIPCRNYQYILSEKNIFPRAVLSAYFVFLFFPGAVSMAGVERGLWNVVGGNQKVPEGLLEKSKANLIKGEVITVSLSDDSSPPTYQVDYKLSSNDDVKSKEYDIVILATPIYKDMTKIKFEDFQTDIKPVQNSFHLTVATYMEGKPNTSYFNIDDINSFPSTFLTCNESVFFSCFSKHKPVDGGTPELPVYRVFSNKVESTDKLKELVPEISDLRVVEWMAYPEYKSSVELPSFTLHDQLYHINAIEMAASAMEMSIVGAKNVAMLAYYRYNGQYDKIDEVLSSSDGQEKTEL